MEIEDKDKDKKKSSSFNSKAYKHAISMIESSGGKYLDNPNSSAAGKYHFLYELIKRDPDMKGVSKREFMNNTELQERIMDKALGGKLSGYTYGVNYAKKLKQEFGSNHDVSDLTALIHFLGPGNTRKYLRNPNTFKVPGRVNATAGEYVKKFRKHFDRYNSENNIPKETKTNDYSEKGMNQVQVDATNVAKPRIMNQQGITKVNLKEKLPQDSSGLDFINEFKNGGQMTGGTGGANELVNIFEGGGSHEENPNGGIPQGTGANGKPNLVEEGETKWDDYIFSNSFSLDGTYISDDGKKENVFAEGGDLTDPPNNDPIIPIGGVDPKKKPLQFTKSEPGYNYTTSSETFDVPDVREQFMYENTVTTKKDDNVNFDLATKNEGSNEFLNRYNDPWTRNKMKEQTQLSDEDIDNMILRGLSPDIVEGNTVKDSKASYDSKGNKINLPSAYQNKAGVETHERVHASMFDAAQGENLLNILGNPYRQKDKNVFNNVKDYMKKPHEAYGNFAEFREKLGIKPGEQINVEELKRRVKSKKLGDENFYKTFDNDKIVEALNTLASVNKPQSIEDYRLA